MNLDETLPAAALRVLSGATLADGGVVDIVISDGRIDAVTPPHTAHDERAHVIDARGWLALPTFADPHIHLDKALTIDRAPNRTGDLAGAIDAWLAHRGELNGLDVYQRAREAVRTASHHGVTAMRTHVDTGVGSPLEAVTALVQLRDEVRGIVDLQIVAGHGLPTSGPDAETNTAILHAALEAGADAVGGAPSLDDDPIAAFETLVRVAGSHGVPLDLHVDETLDAGVFLLDYISRTADRLDVPLTVGHIVSLAVQPAQTRTTVARRLANAGVTVVTLPQTNLFLQGRELTPIAPRGLTALDDLAEAGVTVAAGADNVGDPFNPMGRIDPLETASLLVTAGHRSVHTALDAVTASAHRVMGVEASSLTAGSSADFVLLRATSVTDAVGRAPAERQTWRGGERVASTHLVRTWAADRASLTHN